MGLIGLRIAGKPPDADHPYGHRKFETLAAAGIFVFLLLVVIEVVQTAFSRFSSGESCAGGCTHSMPQNVVITLANPFPSVNERRTDSVA